MFALWYAHLMYAEYRHVIERLYERIPLTIRGPPPSPPVEVLFLARGNADSGQTVVDPMTTDSESSDYRFQPLATSTPFEDPTSSPHPTGDDESSVEEIQTLLTTTPFTTADGQSNAGVIGPSATSIPLKGSSVPPANQKGEGESSVGLVQPLATSTSANVAQSLGPSPNLKGEGESSVGVVEPLATSTHLANVAQSLVPSSNLKDDRVSSVERSRSINSTAFVTAEEFPVPTFSEESSVSLGIRQNDRRKNDDSYDAEDEDDIEDDDSEMEEEEENSVISSTVPSLRPDGANIEVINLEMSKDDE